MSLSSSLFGQRQVRPLASTSLVSSLGLEGALQEKATMAALEAEGVRARGRIRASEIRKSKNIRSSRFQAFGAAMGAVIGGGLGGPGGAVIGAGLGQQAGKAIAPAPSPRAGEETTQAINIASAGVQLHQANKQMQAQSKDRAIKNFSQGVSAMNKLNETGVYTPESIRASVEAHDLSLLEESQAMKDQFTADEQKMIFNRRDQIRKDKSYLATKDQIVNARQLRDLLKTDTPISDVGAQFKTARMFQGGGVLTDQDFRAAAGSQAAGNALKRVFKKLSKGRMTEADRNDMIKIAEMIETKAGERQNRFIDNEVVSISDISGLRRDRLSPLFDPLKYKIEEDVNLKHEPIRDEFGKTRYYDRSRGVYVIDKKDRKYGY
jgi:outer membrane lipoprotein SlyB